MTTQEPLWELTDDPAPSRKRRWVPRCEEIGCGRRIWSSKALTRRFGRYLGDTCYRRRAREARQLSVRIAYKRPGDIPGQLDLLERISG